VLAFLNAVLPVQAKKNVKENGRQTQPEDPLSTDFDPDASFPPAPPLEEVHSFQPEVNLALLQTFGLVLTMSLASDTPDG
jgi:hypothetical protein